LRLLSCAIVSFVLASAGAARAEDLPRLRWDRPVRCMHDDHGGVVRVQCDADRGPRTCLVAPDRARDGSELRRINACSFVESEKAYDALVPSGARIVRAVAEAPPGFERADTGRAYQVQFDLLNRVYVGVAWTPTFQKKDARLAVPPGFPLGRARVETGFEATVLSPRGRSRHDFRVLEGSASFSDLELDGVLFAYDYQHLHQRPAFWLTTFLGKPRLHGVPIPLGWGFRTVKVEDRPPGFHDALDLEIVEAHVSWSPWQSRDLYSHLRFEAGADVGRHLEDRRQGFGSGLWYAGPTGAVRSRLALGQGGLHYLFVDVDAGRPTVVAGDYTRHGMLRIDASFAYEGVLFAINDQPFSVRLAARGATREDPATQVRSVELGATAGLRFSFWAPPRSFEPLPDIEDP